jgi:ParB/RepB/Spo0J family partition protein
MSNVQEIGTHLIRLPKWNSRIAMEQKSAGAQKIQKERLANLAESIKVHGVQTPIQVEETGDADGSYLLVFGTQRLAATKLAGKTTIPAIIVATTDDAKRKVRNVMENAMRTDLTPFETARSVAELRETGLNTSEIANVMGLSKSHVDNSLAIMERAAPQVLFAFEREHPAAKTVFLRQLVNERDHAKQVQKWDEECRRVAAESEAKAKGEKASKGEKDDPSGSTPIRVLPARLTAALDFLAASRTPSMLGDGRDTATKAWAKGLIHWLIGQVPTPPPGFPVAAEPKEEEEAEVKPAKKAGKAKK